MKNLYDMFELNHLIKDPTFFQSSDASCIYNFYTNKKTMFSNSFTVKTGISYHSLICIMFHSTFVKVHQSLYTAGLITAIITKSLKIF